MIKYAKIENEETKEVSVGLGSDVSFYQSVGMEEMDVEQAYNGNWYLKGYAPAKPAPTVKEQVQALETQTGLTRAVRELVLAEGSGASEYVKSKAQEIETLAAPLRAEEAGDDAGTV